MGTKWEKMGGECTRVLQHCLWEGNFSTGTALILVFLNAVLGFPQKNDFWQKLGFFGILRSYLRQGPKFGSYLQQDFNLRSYL